MDKGCGAAFDGRIEFFEGSVRDMRWKLGGEAYRRATRCLHVGAGAIRSACGGAETSDEISGASWL
jgi:hypothetical protein